MRNMDYQGSRLTAMVIITTVVAALGEKEILVSRTIGSFDNVTCGTEHQPCATFNYALSLFATEGGILMIDGGLRNKRIKPYVLNTYKDYVINGSLIIKKKLHRNQQSLSPLLIVNDTRINGIICSGNLTITSIIISFAVHTNDTRYYLSPLNVTMPHYNRLIIIHCLLRRLFISANNSTIINIENSNVTNSSFSYCQYIDHCVFLELYNTKVKTLTIHWSGTSIYLDDATISNGTIFVGKIGGDSLNFQHYIRKSSFINVSFVLFTVKIFLHHNVFIGISRSRFTSSLHLSQIIIYNCSFSNMPMIVIRGHSLIIVNSTFRSSQEGLHYSALDITTNTLELVNSSFINNSTTAYGSPSALTIYVNNLKIFNVMVDNSIHMHENNVARILVSNSTSINGRVSIDKMTFWCFELAEHYFVQSGYSASIIHSCKRCPVGSYTLISSVVDFKSNYSTEVSIPKCHGCPFGGVCTRENDIQAKGGYWGYVINIKYSMEIIFLRCPAFYCCSNVKSCKGYNTCAPNRVGRLCSLCKPGFTCSAVGKPTCINNRKCGNLYINILLYILTALFYMFIIMYLKEIILVFKRIKQKNQQQKQQIEELVDNESHALKERLLPESSSQVLLHMDYTSTPYVISGTVKILFFFYQVVAIVRVDTSEKTKISFPALLDTVSSIFNVRPEISYSIFSICFTRNLQNLDIQLIKHGFTFIILCIIPIFLVLREIYQYCKRTLSKTEQPADESTFYVNNQIDSSVASYCNLPFVNRMKCAYVQILLIGFAGISTFALQSVHCVEIDKKLYLFAQASIQCYQPWQIAIWIFICAWLIPLPIVLYCSCKLLYECLLTPAEFLTILTFPPLLLYKLFTLKILKKIHPITIKDAMLSKHLLMVVDEPFRETQDGRRLCWEAMLMLMRVILVAVNTFMQSPMHKIFPNVSLLFLLLTIHNIVKPFKDAILNTLEKASLFFLISLLFANNFWAFTNEYDLMASKGYRALASFFLYYELFILFLPFLALVAALLKITILKLKRFFKCLTKED